MKPKNQLIYHSLNIHDVYDSRDLDCLRKFIHTIHATHKPSSISSSLNARDPFGKTLLHKLAASSRQSEALEWLHILAEIHSVNANLPDLENGWTPLHRALYHGNLAFARALVNRFDCDLTIKDHEGLSAFELYMLTIAGPTPSISTNQLGSEPCHSDLFTWGSNRNFLLGVHDDGDRNYPERIHLKPASTSCNPGSQSTGSIPFISNGVQFVAMGRLHTALITSEGELRVCGFGSGGRLGLPSLSKRHNHPENPSSRSAETQFTFAPVKGGGLANQRVKLVALGQDHTVVVTELGQVYTFGMNRFGQLGYGPESAGASIESMIQVEPKRVLGLLKKDVILGASASRWHTAVFSSDSLYTWGANQGQLGYTNPPHHSSSCPIQITPRKVSIPQTSIIQLSCMNYETAYLCENSSMVYVLKSDIIIRVVFPFDRFPSDIQVSMLATQGESSTTRIVHIDGSDHTLGAVSSLGDVYTLDLEQSSGSKNSINHSQISSSPHRSNMPSMPSVPVCKPQRVWTSTKWTNSAKSASVGMDGDLIVVTMSGNVYTSSKRLTGVAKGADTRGSQSSAVRKNYKFQRVPYLQRVVQVAASPTGSYAAIRMDVRLDDLRQTSPEETASLPAMLATMLSHLKKHASSVPELHMIPALNMPSNSRSKALSLPGRQALHQTDNHSDLDDDGFEDEKDHAEIAWDARVGSALVGLSLNWIDHPLNGSLDDGDILLVSQSGERVLAHRFVLSSRSTVLDQIVNGLVTVDGVSLQTDRIADETRDQSSCSLPTLTFHQDSLLTLLVLLHYLYTDQFPCLWDDRVWPQIEKVHKDLLSTARKAGDGAQNSIPVLVNKTKADLKLLAVTLSLPLLEQCLGRHGKTTPEPSLGDHLGALLPGLGLGADLRDEAHTEGGQNEEESPGDHRGLKTKSLEPDMELELQDGELVSCHSILMRAQCPFFRLIYDQGAWVQARRPAHLSATNPHLIRFDMGHLAKNVVRVVLQHVYTDDAQDLFPLKDFHSLNEYIDFIFDVLAVANELMMDKLKFICSATLRRCVNLLNVTAIAAEAEFYRADSLQETCINHMIHNLEGIFQDTKALANIPEDLLGSVSNHLKKLQVARSPISRSSQWIDRLIGSHADFLLGLDLPACRATGLTLTSHHWKSLARFSVSPPHPPKDLDLSHRLSPDKSSSLGLTESANHHLNSTHSTHSDTIAPDSCSIGNIIDSKPLDPVCEITDNTAPFVMDDVEADVSSSAKPLVNLKSISSSIGDRSAWATPVKKVIPLDIRTTLSAEKQRVFSEPSHYNRDNSGFASPVRLPFDPSISNPKLSQREKRRQSAEASKSKSELTSPANSTNHPAKMPAWRSIGCSDRKLTIAEVDSLQALPALTSSSPISSSIHVTDKRDKPSCLGQKPTTTSAAAAGPSRVGFAKNISEPNDPASAIGAAIITPSRASSNGSATRSFARRTLGGQDTPWTNYASSCSNFIGPAGLYPGQSDASAPLIVGSTSDVGHYQFEETRKSDASSTAHVAPSIDGVGGAHEAGSKKPANFSIIQDLQAKESWALYGPGKKLGKPKLAEIQEEENRKALERKQEEEFLRWFEEESLKVQSTLPRASAAHNRKKPAAHDPPLASRTQPRTHKENKRATDPGGDGRRARIEGPPRPKTGPVQAAAPTRVQAPHPKRKKKPARTPPLADAPLSPGRPASALEACPHALAPA